MPYCPECSVSVPADVTECPACGASLETTPTAAPDPPEAPKLNLPKLESTLKASLSPTYEVLRPLGLGGMGAVFLAKEPALKRLVAVKVLAPHLAADKRARTRFEREARAAAAISHPNVVRVYAVGETKRTRLPYIVMQYVDGPNLEEWRLRRGRVSERDARRVVGEVAGALAAAHTRDLIHRDVKPSNVLMEKDSGRAFVADFGVSAALSPDDTQETKLTETGVLIGTPSFMSPEQSSGVPLTPKSDVYSLGVLAYQLLTGDLPYYANSAMGWAAAHLRDIPTPTGEMRPELSPAVAQMVDRCLAKAPNDRPTAEELSRGMLPTLESEVEWPPPGLQWLQGRAPAVNRLGLVAVIGAILVTFSFTFVPEILVAHSSWLGRFQLVSQFAGQAVRIGERLSDAAVVSMFLWQGILVVGLVTFVLATIGFLGASFRTLDRIIGQRRLGWRTSTLLDVLTDYDGYSGLVIAGTRDFASLSTKRRRGVLLARRAFSTLVFAAVSWIVASFSIRLMSIAAGIVADPTSHSLLESSDATAILIPGATLLVVAATVRFTERRLSGPAGRPHSFEAEPDDVVSWYSNLPEEQEQSPAVPTDHRITNVRWGSRVAQVLITLALMLLIVDLFIAGLAAFSAAKFTERYGPRTASLVATLEHVNNEDPIGSARRIWTAYLPGVGTLQRETDTDWLEPLISVSTDSAALSEYPSSLWDIFPDDPGYLNVFRRAARGTIPADTLALLEEVTAHSRTVLFRRLAHARFADVRRRLTDSRAENFVISPQETPAARQILDAARANTLAAVLDVARQRLESALERLGENIAIGEH
ncbi:MAG: protein kinase, partial [Gemmatimonadota bacterium]